MRKDTSAYVLIIAIFAALLVNHPSYAQPNIQNRDIVVAVNKLPRSLEPAEINGNIEVRVFYSVFDTLIRRDFINQASGQNPKLMPSLAVKWNRIDNRTLDVTLRRGVKFHNGDTLTADDVVFTFSKERLWGDSSLSKAGRKHFNSLEKVVKIDNHRVRFVTKFPDLMLELKLTGYTAWIVNARSWLKHKSSDPNWLKSALKAVKWNPVGTGPLKFESRKPKVEIKFTAFDQYFMGKPNFRSLTFNQEPNRINRVAGLIGRKYDIAVDVAPEQLSIINKYSHVEARSVQLDNLHVLVFNTKSEKLQDKRLRQALSLAIDRKALRKVLWLDRNITPNGHQLKSFGEMYNADRKGYRYDIERAKELVKKSGYKGEVLSYRTIGNYYLNSEHAALLIIDMWRKIGVKARLDIVNSGKQKHAKGAEIYTWSNTVRLPDPTGGIVISWGPVSDVQKRHKFWAAPPQFNKLVGVVERSSKTMQRYSAFQKMLDIFEDEMPGTVLYNPLYSYGLQSNIQWTPYSIYFMDFRPDIFSIKDN